MFVVGDKVKFIDASAEFVVIGEVVKIDEFRAVVREEYSAGVWGESKACEGRVHSVTPEALVYKFDCEGEL